MKLTRIGILLICILILAFVLRLIVANNQEFVPDEIVYSLTPYNIISAGRLSTVEQGPVYFYLVDMGYKLFGFGPITARLPSILFGSLTTLVIFLLSQYLFSNKNISLLAAFLFAVSGYAVQNNIEMDPVAFFFLLLSLYFFLKYLKFGGKNLYLSSLFLGLGFLAKPVVALVVPIYVLVYIIYCVRGREFSVIKKSEGKFLISKPNLKIILLSILIFTLVLTPIWVYNYLLFKEKGITDFYFTTFTDIGENIYSGLGGQKPWNWERFVTVSKSSLKVMFRSSPIILILGLLGMVYSIVKKKSSSLIVILSAAGLWLYLAGRTGSHFLFFMTILPLFAAKLIFKLNDYIQSKTSFRKSILMVMAVVLVLNLFLMRNSLTQRDSFLELRDYVDTIPDNSLIVVDPLVYTGITSWTMADKHYLIGNNFPELLMYMESIKGPTLKVPLYYIECGRPGWCGWNPDDYHRMFNFSESLGANLKPNLVYLTTITGKDSLQYPVYGGEIEIVDGIFEVVDSTHKFYFYPVGWKTTTDVIDNYTPKTGVDKLLNGLGFIALYIDVILALASIYLVVRWVRKEMKS